MRSVQYSNQGSGFRLKLGANLLLSCVVTAAAVGGCTVSLERGNASSAQAVEQDPALRIAASMQQVVEDSAYAEVEAHLQDRGCSLDASGLRVHLPATAEERAEAQGLLEFGDDTLVGIPLNCTGLNGRAVRGGTVMVRQLHSGEEQEWYYAIDPEEVPQSADGVSEGDQFISTGLDQLRKTEIVQFVRAEARDQDAGELIGSSVAAMTEDRFWDRMTERVGDFWGGLSCVPTLAKSFFNRTCGFADPLGWTAFIGGFGVIGGALFPLPNALDVPIFLAIGAGVAVYLNTSLQLDLDTSLTKACHNATFVDDEQREECFGDLARDPGKEFRDDESESDTDTEEEEEEEEEEDRCEGRGWWCRIFGR